MTILRPFPSEAGGLDAGNARVILNQKIACSLIIAICAGLFITTASTVAGAFPGWQQASGLAGLPNYVWIDIPAVLTIAISGIALAVLSIKNNLF